ncbi:nociceptin receptor isoform X3 [Tursiops truncatus]|uniref:Nociceptin receptor n=1 Tax=Tursiops truncatus TaxID=9739 RepID=A0A6J3PZ52_TURTR|nr:nociceptin receptor isoform X2 [Tursiops truncatus]
MLWASVCVALAPDRTQLLSAAPRARSQSAFPLLGLQVLAVFRALGGIKGSGDFTCAPHSSSKCLRVPCVPGSGTWQRAGQTSPGADKKWTCRLGERHTKMKTATNIYIFNLALADTLVLLTLPFQGTDVLLGFWPFGNALCKTVIAIDYYNMFTSTFTLTAMSVDRYIAICHPIRALDVRTSSKAQAVNVAIWALASVVGVPVAIMGSAQVEDEEIECLVEIPTPQDYWGPVFAICIFLFSFIMPVLIISVCYSLMIRRLRGVRLLSGSREKDRNLRRITRLVLVVVAVFVGCWTPVQVFVLVQGLGVQPGSETVVAILRFCTALGYVNSCLNPILYAFLDENFKACFRKFCCAPTLRREMQVSDRVRSIAKDVAHARKTSEMVPRPA